MSSASQSVLVLAPHPDDETFGCGGTIKHLTASGVAVDVLYMTRGELGSNQADSASSADRARLAGIRSEEARAACDMLGVQQIRFLKGADGRLHIQPELAGALRVELAAGQYQRIFCPWPSDGHPDHRATYELLIKALGEDSQRPDLWLYEVWSPLPQTIAVSIDDTMQAKLAAMRAYRSQLECLDYLAAFTGLAAYRALFCPPSKYAEAFLIHQW